MTVQGRRWMVRLKSRGHRLALFLSLFFRLRGRRLALILLPLIGAPEAQMSAAARL
jgi:hypothetical protein